MGDEQVHPIVLQSSNTVVRVDGYWLRHYAGDFLTVHEKVKPPVNRFSLFRIT